MSNFRDIMIGDYVDVNIANTKTFRYYITKIETDEITIMQMSDHVILHLIKNTDSIWQIKEIDPIKIPHNVSFSKNATDTRYFKRDLTQDPIKRIIHKKPVNYELGENFTELKNGIILYQSYKQESGFLGFLDPSNIKEEETDIFSGFTFITTLIPEEILEYQRIINFMNDDKNFINDNNGYNEVFFYTDDTRIIMRLNLNDLVFTEYEQNSNIYDVYPLRNKKILCLLADHTAYILDSSTRAKLNIDYSSLDLNFPKIYQLSNDDIIFQFINSARNKLEFYRVKISDGSLIKIAEPDVKIIIISILQDDTFLIFNSILDLIQIWDPITNQFTETFPELKYQLYDDQKSILLQNGDVLFYLAGEFYLFTYENKEINEIYSFDDDYSSSYQFINFKQLQNGNIITNTGDFLTILEFPIDQRYYDRKNYDEIIPMIKSLPPDMVALIRTYL